MARIETVLLATDASPASQAAEDHAIELAARLGIRLVVLSVVSGGPAGGARGRGGVGRGGPGAGGGGADATGLTWDGDAGVMIVEAAEAESADLIVVGTHERGAVGRLFLGSVSDHVVRHARCPVMVVRPTKPLASQPTG